MSNNVTVKNLLDTIKYYYFGGYSEDQPTDISEYDFFFKEENYNTLTGMIKSYLIRSLEGTLEDFVSQVSSSNEIDFNYTPAASLLKTIDRHLIVYFLLQQNKKLLNRENINTNIDTQVENLGISEFLRKKIIYDNTPL